MRVIGFRHDCRVDVDPQLVPDAERSGQGSEVPAQNEHLPSSRRLPVVDPNLRARPAERARTVAPAAVPGVAACSYAGLVNASVGIT